MVSRPSELIAIALVIGASVWLRFGALEEKPLHSDESVQGYKTGLLLESGTYQYDPAAHHGPTLYYLDLPLAWLRGEQTLVELTITSLRLLPVIAGVGLVIASLFLRTFTGAAPSLLAAAFLALSPIQVYFSRHFVQEPLLVFFALIAGLWLFAYIRRPGMVPAAGLGLSAGLIHATKETSLIIAASLIAACLVEIAIDPSRARTWWKAWRDNHHPLRDGFVALGAAATVSFLFYSSFLHHPAGILDAFASYFHGAGQSMGSDHDKPWGYYAGILLGTSQTGRIHSELLVVGLSIIGLLDAFARSRRFSTPSRVIRVIGVASFAQLAIYSFIPYKTPWLLMVPEAGLCILAGTGSAAILRILARRRLMALTASLALAAGLAHLGLQARAASHRYAADPRNPLAYVQTVTDLLKVPDRVAGLASVIDRELTIKVIGEEVWPLPWYLRKYLLTGYWDKIPSTPDADVVISTAGFESDLEPALKDDYFAEYVGLRPGVVLIVRTRSDLWETYVATLE